jgi:hypothetical protein
MRTLSVEIDDADEKALEWDIFDLDEWARNAIFNKARRCKDEICKLALEDKTHTILSLDDKKLLRDYLDNQGIIITSVKQLPDNIKREIVRRANIKSAAERNAEAEKEATGE